jgi:metallo-beta-lactamase family protein
MKITFYGAVEEVTGSRYLVEQGDTKILVDCGLFQGLHELTKRNWDRFPIDPKSIDAIVLTHAHIDHTGYIPLFVKKGFKGKIYCSKATVALSAIMLADSGHLQEEDAKHKNMHADEEHVKVEPLYTVKDAQLALTLFQGVEYDTEIPIGPLRVTFIQSGHILGAAFVIVTDGKQKLTFSGDLGRPHDIIMKSPPHLTETDYLVLESTYGDRLHSTDDAMQELAQVITQTVKKGGVLIIPSFAVGRTQTILYYLYQLKQKHAIPEIPIYLDSPMAISVTDLYCKFPGEHTLSVQACNEAFKVAKPTPKGEESKKLDHLMHPAIIISGSGMGDGGRALYHFQHYIGDAKSTVLFVGFQAPGTTGYALTNGKKEIWIYGKKYEVHAAIKIINSLSAHSDYNEILDWLSYFKHAPKNVFLTHGELESAKSLQEKIKKRFGWNVIIPKYGDSFELD